MTTATIAAGTRQRPARPAPAGTAPRRPIAVTAADEEELKLAMDAYRARSGRLFPTWSEVLEILVALGYAKRIWRPVPAPDAGRGRSPGA